MSVGKYLSLVAFVITVAVLSVVLLGKQLGLWSHLPGDPLVAGLIALAGGIIVALAVWGVAGRVCDSDMTRLRRHIEAFSRAELTTVNYRPGFMLKGMTEAITGTLGDACGNASKRSRPSDGSWRSRPESPTPSGSTPKLSFTRSPMR